MKLVACVVLCSAVLMLLLYPLWGVLDPNSFSKELSENHVSASSAALSQIQHAATILWLSNTILAFALGQLALFVSRPYKLSAARIAGTTLIVYPFARSCVDVWMGIVLTSHVPGKGIAIEFSAEKLFFVVFGMAVLGIASAIAELNKPSKGEMHTAHALS